MHHNRFLTNLFKSTLRCTVSPAGEVHEPILSITRLDLQPLQHLMLKSLRQ